MEKAQLRPLPRTAYDLAVYKKVKLQRDGYVHFDNAYYSAPFRLVGLVLPRFRVPKVKQPFASFRVVGAAAQTAQD